MFGGGLYSGFVLGGSGGSGPTGPGYASLRATAGVGAGPTVGANTFAPAAISGATNLNIIFVNNVPEIINVDFTFNGTTITRLNTWALNDTVVIPYSPA